MRILIFLIFFSLKSFSWILPINYDNSNILLKSIMQNYYIKSVKTKNTQNNNKNYEILFKNSYNFYKNLNNYAKLISPENKNLMCNFVSGLNNDNKPYLFLCGYVYQDFSQSVEKRQSYYIILDILILTSKINDKNSKIHYKYLDYQKSINLFWDLYMYIIENENIDYVDLSYYKKLINYKSSINILDVFINESENLI